MAWLSLPFASNINGAAITKISSPSSVLKRTRPPSVSGRRSVAISNTTFPSTKGLFKTIPVCGSDEETITLTIKANPAAFATSFVECTNDDHVLIETE